jgi:hypothetical protein
MNNLRQMTPDLFNSYFADYTDCLKIVQGSYRNAREEVYQTLLNVLTHLELNARDVKVN